MRFSRVRAQATMYVMVDGAPVHITNGIQYDLPPAVAFELSRAGYVRIERVDSTVETAQVAPAVETATVQMSKRRKAVS